MCGVPIPNIFLENRSSVDRPSKKIFSNMELLVLMSCFQLSSWEQMSDWNEYRKEWKRVFWRQEISTTPQKFCYQRE